MAAFLDVEKAFDNACHNGLRYKISMLDLHTKMTRWLSDFLVGRLTQLGHGKGSPGISKNPLVEESVTFNRVNPAWDSFPTPLSVVRPVSL